MQLKKNTYNKAQMIYGGSTQDHYHSVSIKKKIDQPMPLNRGFYKEQLILASQIAA